MECEDKAYACPWGHPPMFSLNESPMLVRCSDIKCAAHGQRITIKQWNTRPRDTLFRNDITRLENEIDRLTEANLDMARELGARAEPDEPFCR